MGSRDIDNLLERSFSGDPPTAAFRDQVLRDSTAAFIHARRSHARRRLAALSTAAVFLAAASFFLGRYTKPLIASQSPTKSLAAETSEKVAVPSEMVAWLEAARFFQQLGMADRMARAYAQASNLLPENGVTASAAAGRAFAGIDSDAREDESGQIGLAGRLGLDRSGESINRIVAQSWGD